MPINESSAVVTQYSRRAIKTPSLIKQTERIPKDNHWTDSNQNHRIRVIRTNNWKWSRRTWWFSEPSSKVQGSINQFWVVGRLVTWNYISSTDRPLLLLLWRRLAGECDREEISYLLRFYHYNIIIISSIVVEVESLCAIHTHTVLLLASVFMPSISIFNFPPTPTFATSCSG